MKKPAKKSANILEAIINFCLFEMLFLKRVVSSFCKLIVIKLKFTLCSLVRFDISWSHYWNYSNKIYFWRRKIYFSYQTRVFFFFWKAESFKTRVRSLMGLNTFYSFFLPKEKNKTKINLLISFLLLKSFYFLWYFKHTISLQQCRLPSNFIKKIFFTN